MFGGEGEGGRGEWVGKIDYRNLKNNKGFLIHLTNFSTKGFFITEKKILGEEEDKTVGPHFQISSFSTLFSATTTLEHSFNFYYFRYLSPGCETNLG